MDSGSMKLKDAPNGLARDILHGVCIAMLNNYDEITSDDMDDIQYHIQPVIRRIQARHPKFTDEEEPFPL